MELRDWGGESRKYKIRQVQQKSDHFGHEKPGKDFDFLHDGVCLGLEAIERL